MLVVNFGDVLKFFEKKYLIDFFNVLIFIDFSCHIISNLTNNHLTDKRGLYFWHKN